MIWALNGGERVLATPHGRAVCATCGGDVMAKCGEINIWHWSHINNDCDSWSEPETPWHLEWKERFPKGWQEVRVGNHRADVKTPKCVVEIQNSMISPSEIEERERHYGRMVWIVAAHEFAGNFSLRWPHPTCPVCGNRPDSELDGCCGSQLLVRTDYITFRWRHPRKSWFAAKRPIFLDFGWPIIDPNLRLLEIKKLGCGVPCGGWGIPISGPELLQRCGIGGGIDG